MKALLQHLYSKYSMKTDLLQLEIALKEARIRTQKAWKKINFKIPESKEPYQELADEELRLEREIAALKGEEYAIPADFPVLWDVGAPLPQLLINDYKTFLLFYRSVPDPQWDGTTCRVVDPTSPEEAPLVLVEFLRCSSAKLGSPNDEVLSGHPLEGRGLKAYSAQQVINSKWIKEVQTINSVHTQYREDRWKIIKHYVFWFHDTTFECLAESFNVELHDKSMPELLKDTCLRLNSH